MSSSPALCRCFRTRSGNAWTVLEDAGTGTERQGAASAWIHWVTIEADGESYQLRNDRSGDVHTDVRPEAVPGYAILGMDSTPTSTMATAVHDTVERWLDPGVPEPGSRTDGPATGTLKLGFAPEGLIPDAEVAGLERAANHMPGAVRRRIGAAYGVGVSEALGRFQTPGKVDALRTEMGSAASGRSAPAPRWLEELAVTLLLDTGAQTREGVRTASMRLDPKRQSDGGHQATEVGTGAFGHLTPAGLVEQVRLSLAFAHDAWMGLVALRNAGKEGEWALNEAQAESNRLSVSERETLEAARDIGQALSRIQRSYAGAHGERMPSALEQAAMAAETLKTVGPTIRTAAGWPGAAPAPNARAPEDIARIATVAEGLHGEIGAIANRLIAGWVAEVQAYGESRNA